MLYIRDFGPAVNSATDNHSRCVDMNNEDPISQFFPGEESVDLYGVLSLDSKATAEDIRKSYRRHALLFHPDKHALSPEQTRIDASTKFQQVGFAYTVLSDEKRRARYDRTGKTDEGFELQAGEDGWETYFAELFDRVTKGKLDEMKQTYQGWCHTSSMLTKPLMADPRLC